jgi:hypothetical protein
MVFRMLALDKGTGSKWETVAEDAGAAWATYAVTTARSTMRWRSLSPDKNPSFNPVEPMIPLNPGKT